MSETTIVLVFCGIPVVIFLWLAVVFDIGDNKRIYMPRAPDKKPK